eukprot:SAG31_NODE_9914_length_1211_cov_1.013489_2_plen_238_part_00
MADRAGRPLTALVLQMNTVPKRYQETLRWVDECNKRGISVSAQVGSRPIGILMGFEATVNPFSAHKTWLELAHLPTAAEKVAKLASDPDLKQRLIAERQWRQDAPPTQPAKPDDPDAFAAWMDFVFTRLYELGDGEDTDSALDYEPSPDRSVANRARAAGVDPYEFVLDLMVQFEGRELLLYTHENYAAGNLDAIREMLSHPAAIVGIGDAGAHVGAICDGSWPTFLLSVSDLLSRF